MKKHILILLSFLIFAVQLSAYERVIVNTGHTGRIHDISLVNGAETLFTAGTDGTVRKWDVDTKRLLLKMQISHLPIVRLAVHPDKPLVALVETDRINTYHLSVWNHKTGRELYSHKISEVPIFLQFSPRGTYLVYGMTDWKSLTFLESESGYEQQLFAEGFGIVSAAFISGTEKTLLTYSPSGEIRYWNLETGEQRGSGNISTTSDLQNLFFVPGGRYLLGTRNSSLYMVDLINGRVVDRLPIEGLENAALEAAGETLAVRSGTRSRSQYLLFDVNTEDADTAGFSEVRSLRSTRDGVGPIAYDGRRIIFSSGDGALFSRNPFKDSASLFARPVLLDIQDIAFSRDMLFLASAKRFFSIASEAFGKIDEKDHATSFDFASRIYEKPIEGRTGLISLKKGGCLLFPREEQKDSLSVFRFSEGEFTPFFQDIESRIQTGTTYDGNLLLLEKNGTIRIISADSGEQQFSYTSFGLRSISEVYGGNLIAARNRTDIIGTPLLHINPNTGETVPIEDSNILTFHLRYDDMTRKLYTLGYEERSGGLRTVLKQHSGKSYDRITTLLSYPGEDPEATLAVDPDSSRIFTSLGYGKVHMYAWNGFTYLEPINHIPRNLYVHRGFLYSLNEDSSVSVWDTDKGTLLMTIFIFNDFSWAVVPKDGKPYTYGGAEKYLHTNP